MKRHRSSTQCLVLCSVICSCHIEHFIWPENCPVLYFTCIRTFCDAHAPVRQAGLSSSLMPFRTMILFNVIAYFIDAYNRYNSKKLHFSFMSSQIWAWQHTVNSDGKRRFGFQITVLYSSQVLAYIYLRLLYSTLGTTWRVLDIPKSTYLFVRLLTMALLTSAPC